MDKAFLEYYRSNLQHIRALSAEFAREFPKIAARLEVGALETRDPFAERILEGAAFLAARVEKKLDDGFPQLLESILNVVGPDVLAPTPSMAVAELTASKPTEVPAGSEFTASVAGSATPVRMSAVWGTTLSNLKLTGAHYLTRSAAAPIAAHKGADPVLASLTLSLQTESGKSLSESFPSALDLYLHMEATSASALCRQMTVDLIGCELRDASGTVVSVLNPVIEMPALSASQSFLAAASLQMDGIRLFTTAVNFPESLKFLRLSGLEAAMKKLRGERLELTFHFKRREASFLHLVSASSVRLGCVPLVNLFRKRSSRALIGESYETPLFAERAAPSDYEIWRINRIEVFNDLNETLFTCYPFFTARTTDDAAKSERNYFNLHRTRPLFARGTGNGKGLGYRISQAAVSLSGEAWHALRGEATQLAADLWCTNADLPLRLRANMALSARFLPTIESAHFLTPPTEPREPLIRSGMKEDWEKLSYLLLNLASWLDGRGEIPVTLLRRLVEVWTSDHGERSRQLAEGIAEVTCRPQMFRFIEQGAVYYESGFSVDITLIPEKYEGTGVYAFGCLLRAVLASFTPVNSLVEVTLKTPDEGVVTTWKMQEN